LIDHPSVLASAVAFLDTLLGPERRKTGWMRAEAAGDVGPWRQQAVLGRSHWDADALRDVVRDYALETLAEGDGVLVIDETGFLKQGKASCGVGRQYTGSAGKITNCQARIIQAAGLSRKGGCCLDRKRGQNVPASGGFDPPPKIIDRGMFIQSIKCHFLFIE
jgi:SRSO17 transposase